VRKGSSIRLYDRYIWAEEETKTENWDAR
jgi:hypothetical protein